MPGRCYKEHQQPCHGVKQGIHQQLFAIIYFVFLRQNVQIAAVSNTENSGKTTAQTMNAPKYEPEKEFTLPSEKEKKRTKEKVSWSDLIPAC